MIDIEVKRPRKDGMIKVYARTPEMGTVTVSITDDVVHIYSPGTDMRHEDWITVSDSVKNVINEIKRRTSPTPLVESSPLSGGDWPKAKRP